MKISKRIEKELFFELALYVVVVGSIALWHQNNFLVFIILLAAWVFGMIFWHKKNDIIFFLVGAVVGSLSEIFCIYYGAWLYTNPSLFGIPMWLPLGWGFALLITKRFAEVLTK
ncbi:MAG: hypothetical protein HZA95_03755 [Candidatus Vogelbacteria bacterium]|nr:hypothetical protein [Candidatus Vogelbacteria bacterium]